MLYVCYTEVMRLIVRFLISLLGAYFLGAAIFFLLSFFKPNLYYLPLWKIVISYIVLGYLGYELYKAIKTDIHKDEL